MFQFKSFEYELNYFFSQHFPQNIHLLANLFRNEHKHPIRALYSIRKEVKTVKTTISLTFDSICNSN